MQLEEKVVRNLLDLGTLSALVNAAAALGCIWVMQSVTAEAGFANPSRLVKLFHRVSYGLLSLVLFANAAVTLDDDSDPRWIDFIVQCCFLFVALVSVLRHRMARPVLIVQAPSGLITKIVDRPSKDVKGLLEGDHLPKEVIAGTRRAPPAA
jgi:hypothetical protein